MTNWLAGTAFSRMPLSDRAIQGRGGRGSEAWLALHDSVRITPLGASVGIETGLSRAHIAAREVR